MEILEKMPDTADPGPGRGHDDNHRETSAADEVCCGRPALPTSPHERPGYRLLPFVEGFIETPAGPVPGVYDRLSFADRLGAVRARCGIGRDGYRVAPGLYGVGTPTPHSPVLVTANFKLTFDHIRAAVRGLDAWILVIDTWGVNVWCAAGKGRFSTAEVVRQVRAAGLHRVVRHRRLILPQLGATGVRARDLRSACGFSGVWGPIRAEDIRAFIDAGMVAAPAMRRVSFTLAERMVLVPVELSALAKHLVWLLPALFLISGIGPGGFSMSGAGGRWAVSAWAIIMGIVAGAVLTPALLPLLPGRTFALKGAIAGGLFWGTAAALTGRGWGMAGGAALLPLAIAVSSYLATNFTGSTPYTSPSGVEWEMRRALPAQAMMALTGLALWVVSAFAGWGPV